MKLMVWGREYVAIITGKADEETKARFLKALREGDPELQALLEARQERAMAIGRLLHGQDNVPEASLEDDHDEEAGERSRDADG